MAAIGILLLSVILLYFYIRCYKRYLHNNRLTQNMPKVYPMPFPILNNFTLARKPEDFLEQINGTSTAQKLVVFFLTCDPIIVIAGVAEAEALFSSMKEIEKSFEYTILIPWLGHGLLTDSGKTWRQRRKLLTPAFHYDILKDFVPIFNEQARILASRLEKADGQAVDIYPIVTLCTLDIICETAMGRNVEAQHKQDSDYVTAVHKLNEILHQRQKAPWLWPDITFDLLGRGKEQRQCLATVKGFAAKVIKERKKQMLHSGKDCSEHEDETDETHVLHNNNSGKTTRYTNGHLLNENSQKPGRRAFLDLLLKMEQDGLIDHQGVQDEVDTFMFEGHDTTSAGICWALFCIGSHAQVQDRAYAEINEVLKDSSTVSHEQLKELNYLERCIKESLRLYPSVPLIGRTLHANFQVGRNTIPAGSRVLINIYSIHRDADYWNDPYAFDPDRFKKENCVGRHPFAYVPFAAGARNCIGQRFAIMEEKVILAWILKRFWVVPITRQDQMKLTAELILRSSDGIMLKFIPRND